MSDTQFTDGKPRRYSTIPWSRLQRYGSHERRDQAWIIDAGFPYVQITNSSRGKQNRMGQESNKRLFINEERLY
jgi:hypothetical protein